MQHDINALNSAMKFAEEKFEHAKERRVNCRFSREQTVDAIGRPYLEEIAVFDNAKVRRITRGTEVEYTVLGFNGDVEFQLKEINSVIRAYSM